MKNKNILIIVTGSIAAYKACEIIRLLRKEGAQVQVMMSHSAQKFVGKASFSALTGHEVITDLFPKTPKAGLEHIELAIKLDAIVVVPATANIICKVANGIADEIVSTTLSVCDQPVLFAPAMNFRMWNNPATIDAVDKLRDRKMQILPPDNGLLASLHEGEGRLPDIYKIMNGIRELFKIKLPLKDKKVLITAGPTRETIDPIRYISNHSSGKMGYSLAKQARDMGAKVTLISGPVNLKPVSNVKFISIESAIDMGKEVNRISEKMDYIFMAAAVADYTPKITSEKKIKRKRGTLTLDLLPCPDIIKSAKKNSTSISIAFALETHDGEKEAVRKLKEKNVDFIVLNYANEQGSGFNSSTNRVCIFNKNKEKFNIKRDTKERVAEKIIFHILSTTKINKTAHTS